MEITCFFPVTDILIQDGYGFIIVSMCSLANVLGTVLKTIYSGGGNLQTCVLHVPSSVLQINGDELNTY